MPPAVLQMLGQQGGMQGGMPPDMLRQRARIAYEQQQRMGMTRGMGLGMGKTPIPNIGQPPMGPNIGTPPMMGPYALPTTPDGGGIGPGGGAHIEDLNNWQPGAGMLGPPPMYQGQVGNRNAGRPPVFLPQRQQYPTLPGGRR